MSSKKLFTYKKHNIIFTLVKRNFSFYLFIISTILVAYFLIFVQNKSLPAAMYSISYIILMTIAAKLKALSIKRYLLSFIAFIELFGIIQSNPLAFDTFTRRAFTVPLLYAYLLPDVVSPNIISICIAYIFSTYTPTTSLPESAIDSCIINVIIATIGYVIIFYLGRRLHKSERTLNSLFEYNLDGIFLLDLDYRFINANPAARKMSGYGVNEPLSISLNSLVVEEDIQKIFQYFSKDNPQAHNFQTAIYHKDGHRVELSVMSVPIIIQDKLTGFYGIITDITESLHMEKKLKHMSLYDSLTGIYNRNSFEEKLLQIKEENNKSLGIIVCDVDGMKLVNDTFGHQKGDELLLRTATILKCHMLESYFLARIGGDEFVILIPNTTSDELSTLCTAVENHILQSNNSNPELTLSLSIGYAFTESKPFDVSELFKKADNNMYKEKFNKYQNIKDPHSNNKFIK
ncbi:diguanylate cyclase [Clostridium bovifaecis]|uniref:Diguanylate cyclase n=1 Tax=Clostridium bovifaecis TaxID=2184719 RepID=A0A6I6F7D2_9CLOT|nr:diguanylate cyclase [Clostridium bovifaecis]